MSSTCSPTNTARVADTTSPRRAGSGREGWQWLPGREQALLPHGQGFRVMEADSAAIVVDAEETCTRRKDPETGVAKIYQTLANPGVQYSAPESGWRT